MQSYPFAQYDAFSDRPFGGSQAAVITGAGGIDYDTRQRIAREIGLPATAFVDGIGADWVEVQFLSTVMELPMCGHGTICMMTYLVEAGMVEVVPGQLSIIQLRLPGDDATVELTVGNSGRIQVMLDIQPSLYTPVPDDRQRLAGILGITKGDFDESMPLEIASGDFVHLVVPLRNLAAIQRVTPDFNAITAFCHDHGIETIAVFCTEVAVSGSNLHVRDFCPAVGVPESAAAGTTNAALSGYLVRHGLVTSELTGQVRITAEQGHEIGRPSIIHSRVSMQGFDISRLQVGGVATKTMDGQIYL